MPTQLLDQIRTLFFSLTKRQRISIVVAALAAVKKTESTVKTSKASVPAGKGYQLSEHVRSYYRTTTI